MAAVVLLAAACSSPRAAAPAGRATASAGPAKAVIPPDTPAGIQLRWLIAAMARLVGQYLGNQRRRSGTAG